MTHRRSSQKPYHLAGHLLGHLNGLRDAVLVALLVALASCGSPPPPPSPDHGTYSSTGAETAAPAVKPYSFPRATRFVIASPPERFPCVRDWADQLLRGKGISFAAVPFALDPGFVATRLVRPGALSADELSALDGALVLAITVESFDGPGGFAGFITSSHERVDMVLAIYEPGNTTALWRSHSRVRAAMKCPDHGLKTQLQQLLAHIQ